MGCHRLFVSGRTQLGGSSTMTNGVRAAPPPESALPALAEGEASSRVAPTRFRDDDDEPTPLRNNNAAAVGIMLGILGLLLVVGVVLALYCFLNTDGDTAKKNEVVAKLPQKKVSVPSFPIEEQAAPPVDDTAPPKEEVEIVKPSAAPPSESIKKPAPKLTPDVQKQIDTAIDRGVMYLRATQIPNGIWLGKGNHTVGYTALPALTLMECGVPKEDPSIQAAAKAVRIGSARLQKTYELALSVLFLDKLGDPKDKKLIQALAMRLVAGQNYAGGWSYECPLVSTPKTQELLTFLQRERKYKLENLIGKNELSNPLKLTEADLNRKIVQGPGGSLSDPLKSNTPLETIIQDPNKSISRKLLPGERPLDRGRGEFLATPVGRDGTADEKRIPEYSFMKQAAPPAATVTDKPASANGTAVPAKDKAASPKDKASLAKDKANEAKSKAPAKTPKPASAPASSDLRVLPIFNPVGSAGMYKKLAKIGDHSNTQFALLGLWAARRHGIPLERTFALAELRFRRLHNDDGGWGYVGEQQRMESTKTMTCVGLLGLAIGRGTEYELLNLDKAMQGSAVKKLTTKDEGIQKGLKKLGTAIGEPRGRTTNLPRENLYLLWSIERVAVLYNLKTIGDKDWYLWGAETLLANQEGNGCWTAGKYHEAHPIIDTCFALLFLKRANLAPDLSDNLRLFIPVVDPDSRGTSGGN
jgi:hypothetical protein